MSTLKGKQEHAISGKQKDSAQKDTLAVSASTTRSVERKHNRLVLLQGRRLKITEEYLRKESPPEAVVIQEGEIKKCADTPLKETFRIRRVISGILPYVNITNQNLDAKSAKSAYSGTLTLTVSPARSRRKGAERDLLPC